MNRVIKYIDRGFEFKNSKEILQLPYLKRDISQYNLLYRVHYIKNVENGQICKIYKYDTDSFDEWRKHNDIFKLYGDDEILIFNNSPKIKKCNKKCMVRLLDPIGKHIHYTTDDCVYNDNVIYFI